MQNKHSLVSRQNQSPKPRTNEHVIVNRVWELIRESRDESVDEFEQAQAAHKALTLIERHRMLRRPQGIWVENKYDARCKECDVALAIGARVSWVPSFGCVCAACSLGYGARDEF
jgi:hypothetical protein